ncbi:MAG: ATP-binding protein, partial [Moraxella sp.]
NPDFAPIAKSLDNINDNIIKQAQKLDGGKFDFTSNTLVSSTNLQKISASEARIISAMLMTQSGQNENLNATHFVEKVSLDNDLLLKTPSTAFIFAMPMTNWKMVIVKPNQELMLFANQLGKQLQWYMLLGFLPVLLLSGYIFHRILALPLHQVARNVREIGQLIAQKKYLSLREHKLPPANIQEIGVITDSMNQLVDRVVENEGALAKVNERLEQQVAERTENLHQALKDLKASQVQLVQSEKMATIGQMVAGVAHEVNTPLGYVGSNLELIDENIVRYDELIDHAQQLKQLMQDSPADTATINQTIEQTIACSDELVADAVSDDLHGLVDDAKFGVSQISELVVNLRDFSRIDQAKIKAVDINDCIKNSLVIARNNIKHLEVITELNAIEPVSCNPSQINQVLLNLFNNAAQAMGQTQHPTLHITSTEDGANVYISVADNGTGMSAETQAKIFEPFFTTKAAGEGTGLGLAISTQIMQQHNGDIHVQSQLGEGTTFTIRLPKTAISSEQSPKLLIAEES